MIPKYLKILVSLCVVLLCNATAFGQQPTAHTVQEGETIESIAKHYKVTPYTIIRLNKGIKKNGPLEAGTIVKIASNTEAKPVQKKITVNPIVEKVPVQEEEPIGFTQHKVRKRETLFSLTKRYNVSEEAIKKYNKQLYSVQLKKGMRLKIPKYRKVVKKEDTGVTINEEDFELYTVKPKETRWSIAHTYGITIDSLLLLNPNLPKETSHLTEGEKLLLPKILGSSIAGQEVQLYESYTVPPKVGFYRLEKEFGITSEELMRLNPEIIERGGLKEGMVLRIPKKKVNVGAINTDNFIFYEVKPKQNEFRLTRKFGMSYEEILALNPAIKDGFKAGMVLKIPKGQTGNFDIKNSLVLDRINLLDSINTDYRPKMMFLLPFRLDKVNLNDSKNTIGMIQERKDLKNSLGLYSGALIALDSIAQLGVSVDVKTFDTRLNVDRTKEILYEQNLDDVDVIFGPLSIKSLKEVAAQANKYKIPVIAPLPSASENSFEHNNIFFPLASKKVLRKHMLDYLLEKRIDENIVVIVDKENLTIGTAIQERFPDAEIIELIEEKKNIQVNRKALEALLTNEKENWVFVETNKANRISSITSILNSFNTDMVKVKMFTTYRSSEYENENINNTHLSNLNFSYPSEYKKTRNDSFVRRYKKRFGAAPDEYAIRGFDITYDILLKLAYKNNLFEASEYIGKTEYNGNTFDYEKDISSGYFNMASYLMTYDRMEIKEIKP